MRASSSTLTFVTGADERYARSLMQLLASIERVYGRSAVATYAWDLGLQPSTRAAIAQRFPWLHLRTADFAAMPAHVRLRERLHNTNGWKPFVLRAIAQERAGLVFWLDSATVLCERLDEACAHAERTGVYAAFGGRSTIAELTHPTALARLRAHASDHALRQRGSAVVGLSLHAPVAQQLLAAWCDAMADRDVLCPDGSSLDNHRFDQSAWNILLARAVREHGLVLPPDEMDVSSASPTPAYRTRNKVHRRIPLWTDPLLRAFFATRRALDVGLWRLKKMGEA